MSGTSRVPHPCRAFCDRVGFLTLVPGPPTNSTSHQSSPSRRHPAGCGGGVPPPAPVQVPTPETKHFTR
jgi:hypothetical protein